MGTHHEAQIETWHEGYVMPPAFPGHAPTPIAARWDALCRWDLGKDYAFARAFYSIAEPDWPRDADDILGERYGRYSARDIVDGKHHADGLLVAALEPVDDIEWCWWSTELVSCVSRLVTLGRTTRVLWWEG